VIVMPFTVTEPACAAAAKSTEASAVAKRSFFTMPSHNPNNCDTTETQPKHNRIRRHGVYQQRKQIVSKARGDTAAATQKRRLAWRGQLPGRTLIGLCAA
jgi:hypothetical protein